MGLYLIFLVKDFQQSEPQKAFQYGWSDWEMELSFVVIKQTE